MLTGLTALIAGLLTSSRTAGAVAFRSTPGLASELAYMLNNERMAVGLAPLVVTDLGAQSWANHLASTGGLYHASGLVAEAENLAETSSWSPTGEAVRMWITSDGHRTNLLNPLATALDVGIACAAGRMVVVARFHAAWAIPTVPAVAPRTPAGVGTVCDSFSPASIGMPDVFHSLYPAENPGARLGDQGWLVSPSGVTVFDTWLANRNVVTMRALVSLPCGAAWLVLTPGASDHVSCAMAAPPDWVAYHVVAEVFDAAGVRIGGIDGWMCNRR
ncbi:MAG: hypothetical protein QOJ19_1547 [Acidimicrobiia bacterium]|nr:hypothetical protein [Acidimicrobiia bacterium]